MAVQPGRLLLKKMLAAGLSRFEPDPWRHWASNSGAIGQGAAAQTEQRL